MGTLDELLAIGGDEWQRVRTPARAAHLAAILPYAQDPAATADVLERIGTFMAREEVLARYDVERGRAEMHRALGEHPNAPVEVLGFVLHHEPASLGRNPAVGLLPVECPDFFARYRAHVLSVSRVLRCGDLPDSFARWIADGAPPMGVPVPDRPLNCPACKWLMEDARMHVSVAGEVRDWQAEMRAYWAGQVRATPGDPLTREQFAELAAFGLLPASYGIEGSETRERLLRAADPETPVEEREALREGDPSLLVRLAAILNPAAPGGREREGRLQELWTASLFGESSITQEDCGRQRRKPRTREEVLAICKATACRSLGGFHWATASDVFRVAAFVGLSHPAPSVFWSDKEQAADSVAWWQRAGAALGLRHDEAREFALLQTLCDDGNRLVRAAARARLADPSFCFRL